MSSTYERLIDNDKHDPSDVIELVRLHPNLAFFYECASHQVVLANEGTSTIRWGYNGRVCNLNMETSTFFNVPAIAKDMILVPPLTNGYFSMTGSQSAIFEVTANSATVKLDNITIYSPSSKTGLTTVYTCDMNNVAFENKNEIHIGIADVKYF